jgi:sugar O-acyltransferase (sialic acid O-acetyltransferase NeuD family)
MRCLVLGSGGHAHVVVDALLRSAESGGGWTATAVLDDDESRSEGVLGVPYKGPIANVGSLEHDGLILAIGDNRRRTEVFQELSSKGLNFVTVVHPAATIAPSAEVGRGTLACAGVVVNPEAKVDANVILNTACTVDHHCRIGAGAHIAPGANLAGNVSVGEEALVGIGASIAPGVSVGARATIGAGSTVLSDVPSGATVVGSPARATKESR